MAKLFVEVYSYHMETMYPLVVNFADEGDILLFNTQTNGVDMLDGLPQKKIEFSFRNLITLLFSKDISHIYINTISLNLYAKTLPVWIKAFYIILISALKLFRPSLKLYGVLHEADQYADVSVKTSARHRIYKKLIGKHILKLFEEVFVLAPEVQSYLAGHGLETKVMSTAALKNIVKQHAEFDKNKDEQKRIVWIGSVDLMRRNWKPFLDLRPSACLDGVLFDMVCDINVADGPKLLQFVQENKLDNSFKFRHYRPDDEELYDAVQKADYIACFYSHVGYGKYKTSGARHAALAFGKDTIAFDGRFTLLDSNGDQHLYKKDINEFFEMLSQTEK